MFNSEYHVMLCIPLSLFLSFCFSYMTQKEKSLLRSSLHLKVKNSLVKRNTQSAEDIHRQQYFTVDLPSVDSQFQFDVILSRGLNIRQKIPTTTTTTCSYRHH